MSFNIRVKFSRKGPVCYTGHLDILRYFQKIIARSGIDICYSKGFNPHQIISFAYPLGVSMETEGDYMDMEVETFESTESIVSMLNSCLNEGIEAVSASVVPDGEPNAMASVAMADYRVNVSGVFTDEDIKGFLSQETIMVTKEGKKGPVLADIKEGIKELKNTDDGIFMKLLSGSSMNIKPATVIEKLSEFTGNDISVTNICRLEIYKEKDGIYKPLGEF